LRFDHIGRRLVGHVFAQLFGELIELLTARRLAGDSGPSPIRQGLTNPRFILP
jgi:hypothetical protein